MPQRSPAHCDDHWPSGVIAIPVGARPTGMVRPVVPASKVHGGGVPGQVGGHRIRVSPRLVTTECDGTFSCLQVGAIVPDARRASQRMGVSIGSLRWCLAVGTLVLHQMRVPGPCCWSILAVGCWWR